MSLTHFQKKFIKSNIRNRPIKDIAIYLKLPEKEILQYLKDIWRADKYEKFLTQSQGVESSSSSFSGGIRDWLKNGFNISALFLLLLLVAVAYINGLGSVFLSDDFGIVQDKQIGSFSRALSIHYTFVHALLNAVVYNLFGLNPVFFRLVNVFFHLGSTWLIYIIMTILATPPVALIAAAIFAVHPILIESVTWISGGGYAQYSFFFLLSLLFYLAAKKSWKYYLLSIVCYFLSLESSVTAISLSGMFFVYELSLGNLKKNWLRLVPYFALTLWWVYVFTHDIATRVATQQTSFYQKVTVDNPLTQIPVALYYYFVLIFWPADLTLYHSEIGVTVPGFIMRVIVVCLFLILLGYCYLKNRRIFFWLSLFIVALLPTLNPLRISWVVAERYAYLATVGIICAVAVAMEYILKDKKHKTLVAVGITVIVLSLTVRTIMRNFDWNNEDNLWIATAKSSPSSPNTHNNMGDVYYRHKDYQNAVREFTWATQINPNYADAYHNMGNAYRAAGQLELSVKAYKKAMSINPNIWQTYTNLADIYYQTGDYKTSLQYMLGAEKLLPHDPFILSNLGLIYLNLKDKADAIRYFEATLQVDPNNEVAHKGLDYLKTVK